MRHEEKEKIKQYLDNSLFLQVGKVIHNQVDPALRFDIAGRLNTVNAPVNVGGLMIKTEEILREINNSLRIDHGLDNRKR
jgi:hypothetical protein